MIVAALAAAAVGVPVLPAAASSRAADPAAKTAISGDLNAVAAASGSDAWAVGGNGKALTLHWNGKAWTRVATPSISNASLYGVAAVSSSDAWAVGTGTASGRTLILHWNGSRWSRVSSPGPEDSILYGISAVSAADAWAVGTIYRHGAASTRTLIVHWNGTSWRQVASPSPELISGLSSVSAVSARAGWAVGTLANVVVGGPDRGRVSAGKGFSSLILRWDGKKWTRVASPGTQSSLIGVSALSSRSAWAVGGENTKSLMLRFGGKSWKRVASSGPGGPDGPAAHVGPQAVVAPSARLAWAVGDSYKFPSDFKSLIWRWNGKTWRQAAPGGLGISLLLGVAAVSADNAWAVGESDVASPKTLILHWNGKAWSRQ
jgi:hypothetical protein